MKRKFGSCLSALTVAALIAQVAFSPVAIAAEPGISKDAKDAVVVTSVELFQAIEAGKIEVKFYPKDASQATVVIKNKGDEPLDIALPNAFGAVHVLGQMGMGGGGYGGGGMGGGGMGGMGGGMGGMGGGMGGGQGMGGGMGGMGGGMGGMGGGMGGMGGGMGGMGGMGGGGMGGGMFRVDADKSRKFQVPCVCLEHGKKDPNPRMMYKIVPIEQINNDPRVVQLCSLLGQGKLPQNTAQAAAWHVANGLSWEELSHKNRVESKFTGNIKFFNRVELQSAFQVATILTREFEKQMSENSSSTSESTSKTDS